MGKALKYYDQHVHSHFSFDSEGRLENYLNISNNFLVTTEHLDFKNPIIDFQTNYPDYPAYIAEIKLLNQRYDNRILKGIEVGYTEADSQAIKELISKQDYDVMLLSVHHNGKYDFMEDAVLKQSLEETMIEYFQLMLKAVNDLSQANILAHFEYGLRRYDVTVNDLKKIESLLKAVFKEAIKNNLAFELNGKSMYKYNNVDLYEYGIELYKSLGGKYFTVGSDAHVVKDYEFHFRDIFDILEQHGIEYLTVFQNKEIILVKRP